MSKFRVGDLDKRVVVEQPPDPTDPDNISSGGEIDGDYTKFATVWASIEPFTGTERFNASQIQANITHTVRMWYLAGVTPAMRIKYGNRYLQIKYVLDPRTRGEELELLCEESISSA